MPDALRCMAGRVDAVEADPPNRMPPEDSSAAQQLEIMAAAGLTPREFLVLSGGHTVRQCCQLLESLLRAS